LLKNTIQLKEANYTGQKVIGVIGSGNFTKGQMLPALKLVVPIINTLPSRGGVSEFSVAQYGFLSFDYQCGRCVKDKDVRFGFNCTTRRNLQEWL
jgi:hypothetical protein